MTRCVIHVGMHKTGSTSIQNSLRGFGDEQFLYADLENSPNHSLAMYSLFAAQPEQHHLHKANGRDATAIQSFIDSAWINLERAFLQARNRTLIISGEVISILPDEDVVKLHDYFQAHCHELKVVGYVRSPAAFIASAFQHKVKYGKSGKLNLDQEYRNYQNTFEKFDQIFGRENVQLWKFDTNSFPDGCVVRDFCNRLRLELPAERIVRYGDSLSRQAMGLAYTFRKLGAKRGFNMKGRESGKFAMQLMAIGKEKFRFSPDAIRPVLEKNKADIEWMEARLGQSLREDLGEHKPGDVREESDLLKPDPEAVNELLRLLGERAPKSIRGETPEEVAMLVNALRVMCT